MTDDRGIFEHWFFKDIVDEQRLALIRLFLGDAIAKECGPVHGRQRLCLKRIMDRLATIQRQDERVRELEAITKDDLVRAMYAAWPHTVISQALENETGLPQGAVIDFDVAVALGASFGGLERHADDVLKLFAGRLARHPKGHQP